MHEIIEHLLDYLDDVRRRPWHVLIVAWLVAITGWLFVSAIPNRYQASARVYVDSQSLLRPLLSGLAVQPNINDQVGVMTKTLISRPNLEKVAHMTDLDLRAKSSQQMESIIDGLEAGLTLKSAGYADLYTISYENHDPVIAKKVVQALLTIFVENGLGSSRKDISSSRKFIDEQVADYENKLRETEKQIKDFRVKNVGLMPGEVGHDYYSQLSELQDTIKKTQTDLLEVENRRDSLGRQLSGEDPTLLMDSATASNTPEIDARIQTLKQTLDNLRLTRSAPHR